MTEPAGIGRLARVLTPSGRGLRDRMFALLAAYFDKSSDQPRGITSVAGYVATLDEWQAVEARWLCGVEYWKRLEGFQRLGGFHMAQLERELGKENADLCIRYFMHIIETSQLQAIGAAILDTDWHKQDWGADSTVRLGSPYEQCLDLALSVLRKFAHDEFPAKRIDVVFCRDGKLQCIDSVFAHHKAAFPMFGTQTTGTGADVELLQCADLGAGCLRQHWRSIAKGQLRELEALPWEDLPSGKGTTARTAFWSLSQGEVLRRLLGIHVRKHGDLKWN